MTEYIDHYVKYCRSCGEYLGPDSDRVSRCYECELPFSPDQRKYAEENPALYEIGVNLPNNESGTVIERVEYLGIRERILAVYGVFAVTQKGIECLSHDYFIETLRLSDTDWVAHMSEKNWVVIEDFKNALDFARSTAPNS